MNKCTSISSAAARIPHGATIMIGGFMGCGNPHKLVDELVRIGTKDLTLIANDASMPNGPDGSDYYGIAKLIHNRQVKTLIASHVGLNPEVASQSMADHTLEVILLPQGSLVEMIRAGGSGLGGILTPTGVGTVVENSPYCLGKQSVGGKDYLLMKGLTAEFALIAGNKIDKYGNVWYNGTTSNFNTSMALAASTVIAEAQELVDYIPPEDVRTPSILVDCVVEGGITLG